MKFLVSLLVGLLTSAVSANDMLQIRIDSALGGAATLNRAVALAGGTRAQSSLKVVTLNLGLLTGVAFTPEYEVRQKVFVERLKTFLLEKEIDVLVVQELWYQTDFNALNDMAIGNGYIPVLKNADFKSSAANYGLQILVREKSVAEIRNVELVRFSKRSRFDTWSLTERGVLMADLALGSGAIATVATTHLTPLASEIATRLAQIRNLAEALEKRTHNSRSVVILGADFNASAEIEDAPKAELDNWIANREAYALFYERTELIDTFRAMNPSEAGFTWNKRSNTLIEAGTKAVRDEPLQRCDFIWVGRLPNVSEAGSAYTTGSRLVFTEPDVEAGDRRIHLSDHFGVFSEILVFSK